ncbi:MAG: O-antigen ligase family protein [Tissierellia bacterium]|nr:O-antigen ligase family protein [Tissierellia bacterium]MDD4781930.1 O-antigen ligase family protein [Tissierellia bacterium]
MSVFNVTGSFDNPAGYAACLAAGFPFCFSLFDKSKIWKYFSWASLIVIAIGIGLSGSRTGIITIILIFGIYLYNKYYKHKKNHRKYVMVSVFGGLLLFGLFFLKKNSALGRLLIWQNSYDMIAGNFWWGNGAGSFTAKYMLYQANYFIRNTQSYFAQLADNVTHPFNEYLLLTNEYGLFSLLLLLILIVLIIRRCEISTTPTLCLISIFVFACFSYPLRYPFIWVLIAYSLAKLNITSIKKCNGLAIINIGGKILWLLIIGGVVLFLTHDIKFETCWGKLVKERRSFVNDGELIKHYEGLYYNWNGDPFFLYNYAALLNLNGDHTESNAIMTECEKYLNDYDVQMIMADNYGELNQLNKAEYHYELAHNMIPNRFMPLFKLMELYEINGDNDKALNMAHMIISKKIKIPSQTVNIIVEKAENLISTKERSHNSIIIE